MNKHAFTFLTLFTLVLLLSAYYITLPNETYPKDNLIVSSNGNDAEYLDVLNKQRADQQNSNNNTIASGDSFVDKQNAISENSKLDELSDKEKQITDSLTESKLEGCFVEIINNVVRVVGKKDDKSNENVRKIMKIVYENVEKEKLVEVLFE